MRNRKNSRVNDGRNLVQLNVGANPIDAEAQKLGGMFTKKGLGKFVVYCPPNAILVKENRLTGNVTFAKGSGLKFMVPVIYKTYFVLASQVNVDYEKIKYQTLDGIDASIDLALFVRVTDPTKYKINSAKPMEDLKITICDESKSVINTVIRKLNTIQNIDILDVSHMSRKVIRQGSEDVSIEYFYTEISLAEVDKWNAIEYLMKKLNVPKEDVIAIRR